jgi:hypothetical protein
MLSLLGSTYFAVVNFGHRPRQLRARDGCRQDLLVVYVISGIGIFVAGTFDEHVVRKGHNK